MRNIKTNSKIRPYLLIFGFVLLSACANKAKYVGDDFRAEDAYFPNVAITRLDIFDERTTIQITTELTDTQKSLIREQIYKHVGGLGQVYSCAVYVTKAAKVRTGSFKKSVRFAVRMEFVRDDKKYTARPHAESSYELSYPDASPEFLEHMYQKVIREAIHNCFVSAKEEKAL